jgi:glycosyltransferase involved in cell wall biosynthesis
MKLLKEMNLLIITDRYPHADDYVGMSFVKDQVDSLKDHVNRIYVISLTPFVPMIFSNFSLMNPRWRRDSLAKDYIYSNVEVYFAKHLTLPFDFSRERRGDKAFEVVNKIINNKKIYFDLIHAHTTYPSGYVASKIKKIYSKPTILTVHEHRDTFLKEVISKDNRFVNTWQNMDRIIRVNKIDLNEFKKFDIDDSKLLYIPNGFYQYLFKAENMHDVRNKLHLPPNSKIILNIANLEEYKGQEYLISAMETVLAERKDILLFIIGQGSLENRLRSMINNHNLQKNIILAGGNKPREEIPMWLNACDIFVLPSLSEGNPTVMFEALGCGKPFVGAKVGGIPEIIINDKLGILVEPRDINGLAEAILRASNSKWDEEYIRDYARQFTWDRIAEKLLHVYHELIEGN